MSWFSKRVEHVKIAQLAVGAHVRVIGNAVKHDGDDVSGPHTGKLGLASLSWIYMSGRGVAADQAKVERVARFAVEDGTGMVIVANEHVKLDITAHIVTPPSGDDGNGRAKPFGASIIARESAAGGGGMVNYHEGLIVPGDVVAVIGTVARDASGALVLVGTDQQPVRLSTTAKQLEA